MTLIQVLVGSVLLAQPPGKVPGVFVDKQGVIKWSDSKKEVALFGANYCLPSACDYRAAGFFTNDRKHVIDQDMSHFTRMGWDGLRVCLWGDYENSDKAGNLVNNDHLDLMDYLIAKASERGIFLLLSPIVTYSSQWPDAMQEKAIGFSEHFKKSELGTNAEAIAAQTNYLKQLLNHINPYTKRAIKDEPNILFIEMINEPTHHANDVAGSVKYINALVDAVKSTGCKKILFHNLSQDFDMVEPIVKSKVDGVSFAWYPTGLNSGMTLTANYLRSVDKYDLMLDPRLNSQAKIVYEFDQPDLLSPTMYPAMVRTFRTVGAQFASIFSYDMLVTAPHNLGWQTHYINMVFTPQKAVSGIIAAEAMRTLPRLKSYGEYPVNTSFGDFRISYEENLSEFNNGVSFMYAGSTNTKPKDIEKLKKIVGYGSSPVAAYKGQGIYFLDKIGEGAWRLEVYPDAVFVRNPFAELNKDVVSSRAIENTWSMSLALPDLGKEFTVKTIDAGNSFTTQVNAGSFAVRPGIYLLTSTQGQKMIVPEKIGNLKFSEFHSPKSHDLPAQIQNFTPAEFLTGEKVEMDVQIVDDNKIDSACVFVRNIGAWFRKFKLTPGEGYRYSVSLPENFSEEGFLQYCITVYQNGKPITFPTGTTAEPQRWGFDAKEFYELEVRNVNAPLRLFNPKTDVANLSFTRIGDNIRRGIFKLVSSPSGDPAFRMTLPLNMDKTLEDYTACLIIKDKINSRSNIVNANAIVLHARGLSDESECFVTFVEADGTSWATKIQLTSSEQTFRISLSDLKVSRAVMLPLGYPGQWNYWMGPAKDRGRPGDKINLKDLEQLQFSVRPSGEKSETEDGVEVSWIKLVFD